MIQPNATRIRSLIILNKKDVYYFTFIVQQTNGGGTSLNHNGTATLSPNQFHDYINISNAQGINKYNN